ncbi:MAG: hypothetical protein QXY87_11655 [Saccharolobus sp.]|uniref:Uncharacterized protein n=1 Tax=Saccharolobus shibatae (strain ATCC 51178 / DSM 5389 / JCM 8931 / NBRC 15437 / B12) TaxID=523848 RepID=A0A8F5BPT3_SACSH|nr:hypothetical protein [Saccharolobus shibatae]MCH4816387.1 hypothetical protein [Saccharolobus shibatae]QXJ29096.1 hypothetical protein J5U23_01965 [Saccharolobus shibatae B12]
MSYKDLVKEAEDFARVLIKKKSRKVLGIYYAIWGFYELILSLSYVIIGSLNVNIPLLYGLVPLILVIPFAYFTATIFKGIRVDYIKLIGREGYGRTRFNYTIMVLLVLMLFISFILVLYLSINTVYFILPFYIYVIFIAYSLYRFLYSKYRLVEPRYYDLIAIVTLLLAPLGILSQLLYSLYIAFEIAWFYASISSLLEVSAVE